MTLIIGASLAVSALVILYVALCELADHQRTRRMRRQDSHAIETFLERELRIQRATRQFEDEQRRAAGGGA